MQIPFLILLGAVFVFLAVYLGKRRSRRDDGPMRPPVQPKPRQPATQPKAPPDIRPSKSAEQIFKEAFPGLRVSPPPIAPLRVRAEACELRDRVTGERQSGFRIDVCGGFEVTHEIIADLVITIEDVTDAAIQQVYATRPRHQDEQTGLFVLRTTVGKVKPPGKIDGGWTSVGVVPFVNLQAPKAGQRSLRLSCVAVPASLSGLSIVDERLRAGMLAAATVTFDVSLSSRGYLEQRFVRQNAAGLVVCLAFAFAARVRRDIQHALPVAKDWMAKHLSKLNGEEDGLIESTRRAMEAALEMSMVKHSEVGDVCRELLACDVPGMASEALEICVSVGKTDGIVPIATLTELKSLTLSLNLGLEVLNAHLDSGSHESALASDREIARLVGLDLSWDKKRIRRHLMDQFMKWNARHPKSPEEREKISKQLNAIARLRQRYL